MWWEKEVRKTGREMDIGQLGHNTNVNNDELGQALLRYNTVPWQSSSDRSTNSIKLTERRCSTLSYFPLFPFSTSVSSPSSSSATSVHHQSYWRTSPEWPKRFV